MKRYTKDSVQTHSLTGGLYAREYPAVRVKVDHYPQAWKVADCKDISERRAEKLLNLVLESAQERFWEEVQETATEIFGKGTKVHSAGRSGGWAVIDSLKDLSDWNAVDLAKWRKFEKWCLDSVKFLSSWDYVSEEINYYISEDVDIEIDKEEFGDELIETEEEE